MALFHAPLFSRADYVDSHFDSGRHVRGLAHLYRFRLNTTVKRHSPLLYSVPGMRHCRVEERSIGRSGAPVSYVGNGVSLQDPGLDYDFVQYSTWYLVVLSSK